MVKNQRNITIDLLRLLSILLIIGHHYVVHGDFVFPQGQVSLNRAFLDLVAQGGKLGVNLFILISGFFLVEQGFKSQRILRLLLDMVVYSLLLFIGYLFLGGSFSSLSLLKYVLLPTFYDAYWFLSIYILLLLASPYLNLLIKQLHQRQLEALICGMLLMWSFFQTVVSGSYLSFSEIGWFILLYLIGAYFRYYRQTFSWCRKAYLACFLGGYLVVWSLLILADMTESWSGRVAVLLRGFMEMNSPFLLLSACGLFLACLDWSPLTKSWVSPLSKHVLGIYMIHDNQFIRSVLWQKWLDVNDFQTSPWLWLHCLVTILLVFGLCLCLDWLIRRFLTARLAPSLGKVAGKIDRICSAYLPEVR